MYYPPVWKDGVNINPDGNYTKTHYYCMDCHHHFSVRERFGEVVEITDDGEEKVPDPMPTDIRMISSSESTTAVTFNAKTGVVEYQEESIVDKIAKLEQRLSRLEQKVYDLEN